MKDLLVRAPVYQQLNDRLRRSLASDFRRGDRFLTEREISEQYGVSRATANKALASLVSEGLIEFRRGVGTFVRRDTIDYDVRSLVSFTEKARAAGKVPTTRVLRFRKLLAESLPISLHSVLRVEPSDEVWELDRVRCADGTPMILEHRYIVRSRCPDLTKGEVKGSLYHAWTHSHGLRIGGANEVIRAVMLTHSEAKELRTTSKSPALEVVSIGHLDDDTPLWWERTLYRGDRYEFHSRLGPIQSATPARGIVR
ncbi:MAG: GntR family transcriptional regulator [Planctomycetaceae bacterium]|nr:GntR family transcriptional regulator [Planctomycetaceae bacterium]